MDEIDASEKTNGSTVEPVLLTCGRCAKAICLRQHVINLALGNTEEMFCLDCLGDDGSKSGEEVLAGIKTYVLQRECFRKEWVRYENVKYCPDPEHCFPQTCFGIEDGGGAKVPEGVN